MMMMGPKEKENKAEQEALRKRAIECAKVKEKELLRFNQEQQQRMRGEAEGKKRVRGEKRQLLQLLVSHKKNQKENKSNTTMMMMNQQQNSNNNSSSSSSSFSIMESTRCIRLIERFGLPFSDKSLRSDFYSSRLRNHQQQQQQTSNNNGNNSNSNDEPLPVVDLERYYSEFVRASNQKLLEKEKRAVAVAADIALDLPRTCLMFFRREREKELYKSQQEQEQKQRQQQQKREKEEEEREEEDFMRKRGIHQNANSSPEDIIVVLAPPEDDGDDAFSRPVHKTPEHQKQSIPRRKEQQQQEEEEKGKETFAFNNITSHNTNNGEEDDEAFVSASSFIPYSDCSPSIWALAGDEEELELEDDNEEQEEVEESTGAAAAAGKNRASRQLDMSSSSCSSSSLPPSSPFATSSSSSSRYSPSSSSSSSYTSTSASVFAPVKHDTFQQQHQQQQFQSGAGRKSTNYNNSNKNKKKSNNTKSSLEEENTGKKLTKQEFLQNLDQLLRAFVEAQGTFSYTQGMSYIASFFLSFCEPPVALNNFSLLLHSCDLLRSVYTLGEHPERASVYFSAYSQLLRETDPELSLLLAQCGALPQLYIVDWWAGLFTRQFNGTGRNPALATRIIDLLLIDARYFIRIAIGIVLYFETSIRLGDPTFNEMYPGEVDAFSRQNAGLSPGASQDSVLQTLSKISKYKIDADAFLSSVIAHKNENLLLLNNNSSSSSNDASSSSSATSSASSSSSSVVGEKKSAFRNFIESKKKKHNNNNNSSSCSGGDRLPSLERIAEVIASCRCV